MIDNILLGHYKSGRLHNTYLLHTDDVTKAALALQNFAAYFWSCSAAVDIKEHPDFYLIEKENIKDKNISIDQIRNLQAFLYKSSLHSNKKLIVILQPELMNINAANACLKIFEDTPKGGHFFLVTTNLASILPTIRSRCAQINYFYNRVEGNKDNDNNQLAKRDKYISFILPDAKAEEINSLLKDFIGKDRLLWAEFAHVIQEVILRLCKRMIDQHFPLNDVEAKLLKSLPGVTVKSLQCKYEKVSQVIAQTIKLDLDLRTSAILIRQALLD